MSWTRLDDGWTDRPVFDHLPFDTRWHYLALVQFCSRTGRHTGIIRKADARRCSDVPDPAGSIVLLSTAGLVTVRDDDVVLPHIDEHMPPPHLRDGTRKAQQREDTRRFRAHKSGDHSLCRPGRCKAVPAEVSAYTGTGRDGPGRGRASATDNHETNGTRCDVGSPDTSTAAALRWQHQAAGYDN